MTKFRLGNTRASKLTAMQVIAMRKEWATGEVTQAYLSRKFQVTTTTVRNVIFGLTWQHLPAAIPDEQIAFEAEQSLSRLDTAMELANPADVGLTPEAIEKLNKELASLAPEEPPAERVDVMEVLERRARERGGQPNDQGINTTTGSVREAVESSKDEGSVHGTGQGPVGTGPLPETSGDTGETGEDA